MKNNSYFIRELDNGIDQNNTNLNNEADELSFLDNGREVRKRQTVTIQQYKQYLLQERGDKSYILDMYRLTEQYMVDSFIQVETTKLNFIRANQDKLKVDSYERLHQHLERKAQGENSIVGKVVILPSTHVGSERCMQQKCEDVMIMFAECGPPDLFYNNDSKW